jgi:hypothetical protein
MVGVSAEQPMSETHFASAYVIRIATLLWPNIKLTCPAGC